MIPNIVEDKIKFVLNSKFGGNPSILDVQSVSGGCINNSCKIISNCGEFFLKWNLHCSDKMFESESKGRAEHPLGYKCGWDVARGPVVQELLQVY